MKLRSSLLPLLFLLLVQFALAQGRYQIGQRVDIDIIMAGAPERAIWQTGTIVRIEDGNYILKMDDGQTRQMPIFVEAKWVRAGTGAAPAAAAPPAAKPMPARKRRRRWGWGG